MLGSYWVPFRQGRDGVSDTLATLVTPEPSLGKEL